MSYALRKSPCLNTRRSGDAYIGSGSAIASVRRPGHRLVVNSSAVPWIYACDCFQLRLIRIQSQTGVREVVASDPVLFNFPVKVQFLPPVFGLKPLVVASDQGHRLAAINVALTTDMTQPPWIVAKVFVFGQQ